MTIDSVRPLSHLMLTDPSLKKQGDLRTGLNEYKFLSKVLTSAIFAIQEGNFEQFDGLVGENACQIRAVWTAIIASQHFSNFKRTESRTLLVQEKIDGLLSSKKIETFMRTGISLKEILAVEDLDIEMTTEEIFLIQAHFLWETRSKSKVLEKDIGSELDPLCKRNIAYPKQLLVFGDISSTNIRGLVSKFRQLLSASSVQFVRDHAFAMQDKHLMRMSSDEFTIKHNNCWPCLPMFWCYKTLLLTALKANIPLVLHVKFETSDKESKTIEEEGLFFSVDTASSSYVETDPTIIDLDKAACVVQGIALFDKSKFLSKTSWKAFIAKHSIIDVILAGAADHRQYPMEDHDHLVKDLEDEEFINYRELAQTAGFSLANPSTFFIQHVYAAKARTFPILAEKAIEISAKAIV